MARLLIVDYQGLALSMSMRALSQGHAVKLFIKDLPKTDHIGLGLVDVVRDWKPHVEWADYIIMPDNEKYTQDMDRVRIEGKPIISATQESVKLESDRQHAMEVFKRHGIDVLPFKAFDDYDRAIAYVKSSRGRFVSKPDDDGGNKALSYVSKNPADMVYMLERWKRQDKLRGRFILQEFMPGTEMAVGGWIGKHGFCSFWCENFEFKKLMPGDMGPNTGEMGTVLRYVKRSKLANVVLRPLERFLISTGHVGYVDVNCIIDETGKPWPLEFTMRFGWPTSNIQSILHANYIDFLCALADGYEKNDVSLNVVAIGACLVVPDFPYSHITRKEVIGMPIYGCEGQSYLLEHVHPCEIMKGKNLPVMDYTGVVHRKDIWATAGDHVMDVTALGNSVQSARRLLKKRLEKISIPNSPFHRNDIGKSLATSLPILQKHGFARGMTYALGK